MIQVGTREELSALMPHGGIAAEVGVWKGEHAAIMLDKNAPMRLFLIDQWYHFDDPSNPNVRDKTQEEIDDIYVSVCERFKRNREVSILRGESREMAAILPYSMFDWVYIDACHEYDAIKADLEAWWNNIKSGGFLAGHDYCSQVGVQRAVDEFVVEHKIAITYMVSGNSTPSFAIRKPV